MRFCSYVGALLALTLLTGCFDNKYDLSDIDDTIGIEVKDLVVPVNLDPVEFSAVIDLDDQDGLEVNELGQYAISKSGSFSEVVHINTILATPYIEVSSQSITIPTTPGTAISIPTTAFDFTYEGDGSDYIVALESGRTDVNLEITISTSAQATISDAVFQLPKGLYGYYDANGNRVYVTPESADATMTFPGETKAVNSKFTFVYHITSFDAAKAHIEYSTERFAYNGNIALISGKLTTQSAASTSLQFGLRLDNLEVTAVTGDIVYNYTEFDHQIVNLSNLPEVLKDPNTNVALVNPQVYVKINNPIYEYGLRGTTGLRVSQQRPADEYSLSAVMTNRLTIGPDAGMQYYMICPQPNVVTPIHEFDVDHLERYAIPGLGQILSGRGLPPSIDIEFVNPRVERGHVSDFQLGVDVGTLVGYYTFYAPLTFANGSQVIYTGESNDWGFGDDEDFEITTLNIKAHLRSDLPVSFELTASPIDEDGNVITHNGKDVTVTVAPAVIPANADCDIVITMSGSISHLDGIRYTAKVAADADAATLRPDMGLSLTDIRAKVSGRYTNNSNNH